VIKCKYFFCKEQGILKKELLAPMGILKMAPGGGGGGGGGFFFFLFFFVGFIFFYFFPVETFQLSRKIKNCFQRCFMSVG
jgi:hypothetical protein